MIHVARQARIVLAAATAALALASCSAGEAVEPVSADPTATPATGGTLHIADEREALGLNPYTAIDNNSAHVFAQILETLFRTDENGEVVPWLVESSEANADFTTWTFGLREGVTFSDGTPMTADDVVYSIETVRQSEAWVSMFAEIETVEATSPSTVVVTTSVPSPALEASLSLPFAPVVPADLAGLTPEEFSQHPVGTGPFRLESWTSGQRITLVRNESYWVPGRPYLDSIVFEAVPSDSNRTQQLRGGDLDIIATPPRPQLEALDDGAATVVGQFAMAFPNYLLLNQESDAFADPRVREAVDLAIHRANILEAAGGGVGELGGSFLAPALDYHDASLEPVERDPARAAELLDEAVADGADRRFTLSVAAGGTYANLTAQIIQENLEDAGFDVTIEQLDGATVLSEVGAGRYDATLFTMTSDIIDPLEVIGYYVDLNALWTGGETAEVATLLEEAKQAVDQQSRSDLYARIQQVVYDDRSLVVLGYQPWVWAWRTDVVGFEVPMTGVPWLADTGFRE